MLTNIVFHTLGFFIFLYLFWRRLKEDYISNQIFSTAFIVLLGLILVNLLANNFFPAYWFWSSLIGVFIGLAVGILRFKLRIFEILEAAVFSLLPWLALTFLNDSMVNSKSSSFIGFFVLTLLVTLFIVIDKHYKKFTWYKSGRIGFTGLSTAGLFFLIRSIVALTFDNVLSFSGKYDAYLSALIAFSSFLLVFNLARAKT